MPLILLWSSNQFNFETRAIFLKYEPKIVKYQIDSLLNALVEEKEINRGSLRTLTYIIYISIKQ